VKRRIAFVVQRCGNEVNGGAEAHCLTIAQRMSSYWRTEVLTTCALDYIDWANHYPPGVENIGNTRVHRFPVAETRDIKKFDQLSSAISEKKTTACLEEQEAWMRAQGPWSPGLFDYIQSHSEDYDAFIFFGYLYAQTWFALPGVAHKALLAPLGHDEWTIYLNMWDDFFTKPAGFIFNTIEERDFLQRRFPSAQLDGPVVGVAVDRPTDIDPLRFRREHAIDDNFMLYIGRIDPSKGCDELFDFFIRHRNAGLGPEKLVLLGKPVMPVPEHPDILCLGFIPEQTKWDALAACSLLVMPSPHESLSMVLLEAWSVGAPVIVNAHCDVLVGQCRRSNGGVWYKNFNEFSQGLVALQEGRIPNTLGRQGWMFVKKHYFWPIIEQTYLNALDNRILKSLNNQIKVDDHFQIEV
jgi:glycosyltransferase involved in cell wall biosynthesis